jgi:hypothetical protein
VLLPRSQMDKGELPTRSAVGMTWEVVTDMQEMTIRSGHYAALLETTGARGATKLHADEREQLLAVADALLFGDPDSEQGLARALDLIARLRESERWSAQSRAELREHLCGCGPLPAGEAAARVRPARDQASRAARRGSSTPHSVQNTSSLTVGAASLLDLACAGCAVAFTP